MKRVNIYSILIVFIFFYFSSCSNKKDNTNNNDIFYVKVEKVVKRNLRQEVVLFGSIKGKDEAIIYPRISGKLIKNLVKEGDYVKKDEPIALIRKDEVGALYEPAPVPSTLSGYIGKIYQDEGADVNPLTPIAIVVDQSFVKLQCDVPEKYISQVKLKQKLYIKIDAYGNKMFYGSIDKISPILDKASRTFQIESIFENNGNLLRSGMTAEVHIILNEVESVPTVPVSALVYHENIPYIYIVDRKNQIAVEKKAIIGFNSGDYVWIKNIKEGEEIVTVGVEGLNDGAKINVVE